MNIKINRSKLHKRIISSILAFAIIVSNVYLPVNIDMPIISEFTNGKSGIVKAAGTETCPYSDSELDAGGFVQGSSFNQIDTVEKLSLFSWWYREKADGSQVTNAVIGVTDTTSFGGYNVINLGDNFTSIGTSSKPFYGTIRISSGSADCFFCKKPLFGYIEQASKIVDQNNDDRSLTFIRTVGYNTGNKPTFDSLNVFAESIVNNKGTSSSSPLKVECELVTVTSDSVYSNFSHQDTCGLVGSIGTGAYAELAIKYNSPNINVTGSGDIGLFCDEMDTSSHLVARILNTSAVSYSITSSDANAGGIVGKMKSNAVLVIASSGNHFDNVTQTVNASSGYAGGLVGYSVDAYIGSSEPGSSTPYTLSIGNSVKTDATTLNGSNSNGNGYISGYYKNTVGDRVFDLSGLTVSSNLFTTTKDNAGGLFGVLCHEPDTEATGFAGESITIDGGSGVSSGNSGACRMVVSAGGSNSGGLVGKYKTNDLRNTFTITDVFVKFSGNKDNNVGGMIGTVDDSSSAAYIVFSKINSERSSGSTGGGLIGKAGSTNTKGVFVDVQDYIKIKKDFGAGLIYSIPRGVLRIAGTTDLTDFKSGNMIVCSRDSALVYSRGTGADSTWTLNRPTASISKDDIGTWGEVLRLTESGLTGNAVVNETNYASQHKVSIPAVTVSGTSTTVDSLASFAILALNMQHNTADTSEALGVSGSSVSSLRTYNITLTDDIDLRNTGIVGLTRDGGTMTAASGSGEQNVDALPYTGTFDGGGHTVTLAIGESYGSGSLPSEGNGRIYNHRWSGLFASINDATIQNLTVNGTCNKKPNNGTSDNSYLGGIAAAARGTGSTISGVTSNITCNIYDGSIKNNFIGGMIGGVYSDISGTLSFSGCSSSVAMNDYTNGTNSHFGGYISYIDSTTNALTVDFNVSNSTSCSVGGSYTNSGHQKNYTVYGGLIGAVRGTDGHDVKTTININDLKVDNLSIISSTKNTDSDTEGSAGILGYAWIDANVNINKLDIGSGSSSVVSSTVTGGKNAAGLVYCATGHWIVKRIDNYNASIITASSGRLGLLVTRGINEASVSAIGSAASDANSALYLEVLDQRTNASGSAKNFAIGSASVTNASDVFDEIVAFTHKKDGDITVNGKNAVISINTDGSGTDVTMTGSSCNTYQNKTLFGSGKVNEHSRYYYNLDSIRAKSSKSDAEKFLLWSVKTYANPKIASKFGSSFTLGSNASLDMNGLSYYTIDYASFDDLSKIGTVKFYNKEIEDGESGTGNTDSVVRSTTSTSSQSQHYMMHCGLFRNATGSVSVGSLTLQGNVGVYDGNCGFIISGVLGGSDTTASSFSDIALTLNGATINTTVSSGSYAPLVINNVEKNTTLNVNTVRSSGYTTLTSGSGYAASSLIGKVGKDDETDTGINLTFSDIALDARKTSSSVTDATQKGLLDSKYGSYRTIFSNATLLHHYFYSGTSSTGTYNYTHEADWGPSGTAISAAPHDVTYGQEIINTVDHRDSSTPSKSEQNKYYGSDVYTSPLVNNLNSGEYSAFETNFIPYVYDIGTLNGATGSNADNKHELRVNIAVTNLNVGCGTYNDPYVISTPKQIETLASLINDPGSFTATDFIINLPSDGVSGNLQWCSNCDLNSGESGADHYPCKLSGSNFVYNPASYSKSKTDVSNYLAGAYYLIDTPTLTLGNSHTLGTGTNAFHGVIVGKRQTGDVFPTVNLSTGKALVENSDGCVIKNLNFVKAQFVVDAQTSKQQFDYTTSCKAYGGIINKIMGGDNIIDNVGVSFASTPYTETSGTYNHTIPVGGYVGVVLNGGLFFRNMNSVTNKTGLTNSDVTAAKYLYRNPIIGRVLNGYAVCEDCNKLDNGDKNYYITQLDSTVSDKLTVTSSAITAKSAQAWFVLSLLVNSGTMSDKTLYINSNHKSAHRGSYDDVGCKNTKTIGASGTVCDNAMFVSGAPAETGNVKPYLMTNYTKNGSSSGDWLNTSAGYDITMNDNEMAAEQKVWTLDKGYRGIGGFNGYDTGSSIDGSVSKKCNNTCIINVKSLSGNSTTINLDMKFIGYRHEVKKSNGTYAVTQDNYSTTENGFGLFNLFSPSKNEVTVENFVLSGTVYSDYVDKDTGEVFHDYPDSEKNWNAYYAWTITNSRRLSTGMFAGTKPDTSKTYKVTLSNVSLNNASVHSGKHSGGFIGNASNVTISACPVTNVSSFGRSSVGGLMGYASDSSQISGAEGGTDVTIISVIEQAKGYSNNASKTGRHSGVGGLVGMSTAITIENINLYSVDGGLVKYDNLGSDDSSYAGGILGVSNGAITIRNCNVNQISVLGTANRVGGLAGGTLGNQTLTATNVTLDGGSTAYLACTGKESVGGIIGYSQAKVSLEDVIIKNYTIQKNDINESSANAMGGVVGSLFSDIDMKNVLVANCSFEQINTANVNLAAGGIIGRVNNNNHTIKGYNIVLRDISINNKLSTKYNGNFIGTGTPSSYKIVGFSLQGTLPTAKLINNTTNNPTAVNQSTKYIIFSDYTGVGIPDPTNNYVGSGYQPRVNGIDVAMSGALNSPFATSNPGLDMAGEDLYTGDGMASTVAGLPIQSIILDMDETVDVPNKKYTVMTAETNFKKYNSSCFSTFKTEWSDADLPDDFEDFAVLLVEDPSRANTTEMINSYLQLLTNTNYNVSDDDYSSVYSFAIKKVQYDIQNGSFDYSNTANLKYDASDEQFYMGDDADTDESKPTFTLLDVSFKDPTNASKNALHLYIPIIVKKMIDVDFVLATGSGTPFDSNWYSDNHRYDTGKLLAENIGSTGTLYFTYTYKRTQKEWQDAMEYGENFLSNYDKALTLTPFNLSENLTDFPDGTQMVLVDPNPGRLGKEYYSDIATAYNSTTKKLSLSGGDFFTNPPGETTEVFTPVSFSDLLNITAVQDNSGKFVIDNDNAKVEATLGGVKTKFRLATSGDTGTKYKLTVVNVAGNNTQAASSADVHPEESYYLSFYTKLENEPSATANSAIHAYTVTADKLSGASGSTKAKYNTRHDKTIIFANLFEQTNVKYYTYKNPNLTQYTPEEINDINDSVFVHLEAQIGFTSQASSTFSAQLSSVDMYQSFLVYMYNTENSKKGIYGNPGLTANITVNSVGGNVEEATYAASTNARNVLNYTEVLTGQSISSYLNDGGALINADLTLSYPNLGQRTSQFASRSGNNTPEDSRKYTTVSACSKIGFDHDSIALSKNQVEATLKTGSDEYQNYRYYIISRKEPTLDYYAYSSDDGRQFGQLGINANDLPDSTGKVTIETAAEFDVRPISSLVADCDTVKITFTLQQKKQDSTFNYTEYESLDSGRSITDYLYNVHVNLTGASNPVLDPSTNTYSFTVPRSSVIALDDKPSGSSEYMKIPIVFDVFTGSDTPKDSDGNVIPGLSSFESKNLRYANYKVVVSAQMMNNGTPVGEAPNDDLIYTNAKLLVDYIK